MARRKSAHSQEKRRREIAKQKKRAEKAARKKERRDALPGEDPAEGLDGEPQDGPESADESGESVSPEREEAQLGDPPPPAPGP